MLLLGIDIGTSSIKVSVINAATKHCIVSTQYPDDETAIVSTQPGWAEQSPKLWWENVQQAILKANATNLYSPKDISAIGIAYQMHGLVVVDKDQQVLRDSIIWCDSRAVAIGNDAFKKMGEDWCLSHLLNSPGNFTASKLSWVKENEPETYKKIDKILLPGDYIAMKLSGNTTTSIAALSEGVFWDFKNNEISSDILSYFDFSDKLIPPVQLVFSEHGQLKSDVAFKLSLKAGIPISYKSGDQPNNAFSLNVSKPGEVAATAGTSGVIYGISDQLIFDPQSRINTFAHVNHTNISTRLGVLLCINGTGILNQWLKNTFSATSGDYQAMNNEAKQAPVGSDGLRILPFGNGAERMLNNKIVGAHFQNIDLNSHKRAHILRASQEGIAFSFRYGLDIMRENGMNPEIIRAGNANLFLSELFVESFANTANIPIEIHQTDGSIGAALGAGVGAGQFGIEDAYTNNLPLKVVTPNINDEFEAAYQQWKELLEKQLA